MNALGRALSGVLFLLLLILCIILGTFRFELLNTSFLFSSFERHGVYKELPLALANSLPNDPNLVKEEKLGFTQIANIVSPDLSKRIIENNITPILDFVNGTAEDIKIFIPAKEFGLGSKDMTWSLSQLPGSSASAFAGLHGLGQRILIIFLIILALLIGLFIWIKNKNLLLISGVAVIFLGGISRLFFFFLEKTLPAKLEPAQALLKLLASSLFADIAISWMIIGIVLIIGGIIYKEIGGEKNG